MNIGDYAITIGGSSVVTWVGKLVYDLLVERFKGDRKYQFDKNIDLLRADVSRINSLMTVAINSFSTSHQVSIEKRISVLDNAWKELLEYRLHFDQVILFYSMFLPDEYSTVLISTRSSFENLDHDSIADMSENLRRKLDEKRLFLGEELWILCNQYRTILARSAYMLLNGIEGYDFTAWIDDTPLLRIIEEHVPHDEFQSLTGQDFGFILGLLESKILFESNKHISGIASAELSFDQAKRIYSQHEDFINNDIKRKGR